jgi:hypothetical protein
MGKIYGNAPIVQVCLINNRHDKRIAEKEYQIITQTVQTIEDNFYRDLFFGDFDYNTTYKYYKGLFDEFVYDRNKKTTYYKVHPTYFEYNFKPIELYR